MTNADDVRRALRGIDTIFHVAAVINGPRPPFHRSASSLYTPPAAALLQRINVDGTKLLLEESCAAGIERFVLTSSGSVIFDGYSIENGDESNPYAGGNLGTLIADYVIVTRVLADPYNVTKAQAEQLVLEANGRVNGVRGGLATVAIRHALVLLLLFHLSLGHTRFTGPVIRMECLP